MTSAPQFSEPADLREHIRSIGTPRVVLVEGCFDPLHAGHIRYLREAATLGDFLVAAVYSDESARQLLGEGRPIVDEAARSEVLGAVRVVDAVVRCPDNHPGALLDILRPAVFAGRRGAEADAGSEAAHRLGIEVVRVGDPDGPRSADVVRRIREGGE